jgi:ABC-type oligopeptide transport system substrate-binding subunit
MKLGLTYHTGFDYRRSSEAYQGGFALLENLTQEGQAGQPPAPHDLRWDVGLGAVVLDPVKAIDVPSYDAIRRLFSGLVQESSTREDVMPDVAKSWEILDSGCRYVFHLRDDVSWSDGRTVTAGDFEFAWRRMLHPTTAKPLAGELFDIRGAAAFHRRETDDPLTVGVRALDDTTLVVELERPAGYFLQKLVRGLFHPVPRHVVEVHDEAWTSIEHIVTNGSFMLEAFVPAQLLIVVRNPGYHGRSRGNVQRAVLTASPDEASARAALERYETDDLDLFSAQHLSPSEARRAFQRHAGDYLSWPDPTTFFLGFNTESPPFDDARVRRALALAVDRERLIREALGELSVPASGGFVPPGMPGHSPDIGLPYDPAEARRLLAEAGYPGGRGFPDVQSVDSLRRQRICEHLRARWKDELRLEIGWDASMQWSAYLDLLDTKPPPLIVGGWTADYPDPHSFLSPEILGRHTGPLCEEYLTLIEQAKGLTNQKQRMSLYREADRMVIEEAIIMPLHYWQRHELVKPWVVTAGQLKDVIIMPH